MKWYNEKPKEGCLVICTSDFLKQVYKLVEIHGDFCWVDEYTKHSYLLPAIRHEKKFSEIVLCGKTIANRKRKARKRLQKLLGVEKETPDEILLDLAKEKGLFSMEVEL